MTDTRAALGLVVVGGGPAAVEAVRAYRDAGGEGPVTIVSSDDRAPYERPPLSKDYLRGETDRSPAIEDDDFFEKYDVRLRLSECATALDTDARMVRTDRGRTIGFDACVLATGSTPRTLEVPGSGDGSVHVLRLAVHAEALRVSVERARRVVVCGSGFVGCEAAASLAMRGLDVVLVSTEESPLLGRLGADASARVLGWLAGTPWT